MPQLEHIPHGYHAVAETTSKTADVQLKSAEGDFDFTFEALRPGLFRTTFTSPKHLLPPHRAAAVPERTLSGSIVQATSTETKKDLNVE
jgi:hypothetical protein